VNAPSAWASLHAYTRELSDLESLLGLLEWDQQVNMPPAGGAARARQIAMISKLHHARLVDDRLGDLLDRACNSDLTPDQTGALANLRRDRARAIRVPSELVAALSSAQAEGFQAWLQAKSTNDFASFQPALERIFSLKREEAAAIDSDRHPYDVLLEGFDPGTTLASLRPMFSRLAEGLQPLIDAVRDRPVPRLPEGPFDLAAQEALHREVIAAMGFDSHSGRLDASEHPFTVGINGGDTRITTHLYPDDLLTGLGGTMHEAGHGLYEQGLLKLDQEGTSLDRAAGLGLHESQSRFWENHVGRSAGFMRWLAPHLSRHLGQAFDADTLYRAANPIEPSLIRIFADEVTYNLHIIARFQLEVAMLEGDLAVADLPDAWNAKYQDLLGITPPDDASGCLQDVHWGSGAVAYFPSYTLGNLFAASLWAQLQQDRPALDEELAVGDVSGVLAWLRDRVHRHGQARPAVDIVRGAVGDRDGVANLLDHVWSRHGALYGLSRPD